MAEEQESSQEKTEQATPKRIDESREKGQITRSKELSTMSILLVGSSILFIIGDDIVNSMMMIMEDGFTISRDNIFNTTHIPNALADAGLDALQGLSVLLISLFLIALVSPLAVGGWNFSVQAMAFKLEKLDPIKGLKRVFGVKGLMELVKALAKFLLIGGVGVLYLWLKIDELMILGRNGLFPGLVDASNIILTAFVICSAATMLITAVDVPFQLWEQSRQLKMSKQEVKDELKETEGKPEVKAHIREMQQQLSNQRMLEEVPKADVIITNPTHYAVALSYEQDKMGAPRLLAKGVDHMAHKIRLVADKHKIITFPAPLLARALYFNTKVGQEIPAGLYLAVAQVLAYIYQLRNFRLYPDVVRPDMPKDISLPDEYRKY